MGTAILVLVVLALLVALWAWEDGPFGAMRRRRRYHDARARSVEIARRAKRRIDRL